MIPAFSGILEGMNVKRFLFLVLLSAALLPLCGCEGDAAEPESTPSASAPPASTPTPAPAPLLALYGAEDGGGFAAAARQIASRVENRMAFALLFLRIDIFAAVVPTLSQSSPSRASWCGGGRGSTAGRSRRSSISA